MSGESTSNTNSNVPANTSGGGYLELESLGLDGTYEVPAWGRRPRRALTVRALWRRQRAYR